MADWDQGLFGCFGNVYDLYSVILHTVCGLRQKRGLSGQELSHATPCCFSCHFSTSICCVYSEETSEKSGGSKGAPCRTSCAPCAAHRARSRRSPTRFPFWREDSLSLGSRSSHRLYSTGIYFLHQSTGRLPVAGSYGNTHPLNNMPRR